MEEETFKIMVSNDLNLGFNYSNKLLIQDSLDCFEEIIKKSIEDKVDILIFAGNLLYDNQMNYKIMNSVCNLLENNILGQWKKTFEVLSTEGNHHPNFLLSNTRIKLPIFLINGRNDQVNGILQESSTNLLKTINYVNYFGKPTEKLEEISLEINAYLFQKGQTKIALYGLNHIEESKLKTMMDSNKINFKKPENYESYFKILIIHQKRLKNERDQSQNLIDPLKFPSWMNLIIWGGENESKQIESISNEKYIYQPGSPLKINFKNSDSVIKSFGLLQIKSGNLSLIPKFPKNRFFHSEFKTFNGDFSELKIIEEKIEKFFMNELKNIDKLPFVQIKIVISNLNFDKKYFKEIIQKIREKYNKKIGNPESFIKFKYFIRKNKKIMKNFASYSLKNMIEKNIEQEGMIHELPISFFLNELENKNLLESSLCEKTQNNFETLVKERIQIFCKNLRVVNEKYEEVLKNNLEIQDFDYEKEVKVIINHFNLKRVISEKFKEKEQSKMADSNKKKTQYENSYINFTILKEEE